MRALKRILAIVAMLAVVAAGLAYTYYPFVSVDENSQLERAEVIYVVDGDTLCVQRESVYGPEKVRLIGVDCPESVHPDATRNSEAGVSASDFTKSLLPAGSIVWLQKDQSEEDRYGRLLRYVWLEEPNSLTNLKEVRQKMLNAVLLTNGQAKPAAFPPDTAYEKLFDLLA